jgi:WS/DGAT/MGAT family acyltransferase
MDENKELLMKKMVSDTGQFWLTVDNANNLSIFTGLIELSAPIDVRTFRKLVQRRLLHLSPFREKIIEDVSDKGKYYWIEDQNLDVRTHVEVVRLKNENDPAELQKLMSDIISVPMDMRKPLWQFILVKKYQNGCAIIARMHQCLMDRVDLIQVLWSLSDISAADKNHKKTSDEFEPEKWQRLTNTLQNIHAKMNVSFSAVRAMLKSCLKPMTNPFYLIEKLRLLMGTSSDRIGEIARIILMNPDSDSVLKSELGQTKQFVWSQNFSLNKITSLSRATNASSNVIFISTLAGAIKEYLKFRKDPIDYREIRAVTPVDMRVSQGGYSGTARFGLIPFDLPVHIDDPVLRISEVKRRLQNLDNLPDAVSVFSSMSRVGISAKTFVEKIAIPFSKKNTLLMTNTQGPPKTLYINNIPASNIMFWFPRIGHIGLGTTILSYNQNVRLGVVCDSKQMPDPNQFIDAFERQLTQLLEYTPQQDILQSLSAEANESELTQVSEIPIAIDNVSGEMNSLG